MRLCHLRVTHLWCDAAEVPPEPDVTLARLQQKKTPKNSALGLKAKQNPPADGFRGPSLPWLSWFCIFFSCIQQLSVGYRSNLRQSHCHDRWDGWTEEQWRTWKHHTSGKAVHMLWWKLLNNLKRLYKISLKLSRIPSVYLHSVFFCMMLLTQNFCSWFLRANWFSAWKSINEVTVLLTLFSSFPFSTCWKHWMYSHCFLPQSCEGGAWIAHPAFRWLLIWHVQLQTFTWAPRITG